MKEGDKLIADDAEWAVVVQAFLYLGFHRENLCPDHSVHQ